MKRGNTEKRKESLVSLIKSNLSNSEFKSEFSSRYPNGLIRDYHKFLSIAVPKLIIDRGLDEGFDVTYNENCTYIGSGLETRMVAFIFHNEYRAEIGAVTSLGELRPERILQVMQIERIDINELFEQETSLRESCLELAERYSEPPKFGSLVS